VLALVIAYFTGINPMTLLGMEQQLAPTQSVPAQAPPANDPSARFVAKVLASTEDVWTQVFKEHGKTYQDPKLVLYSGSTPTACGHGQAAMGPFYCPMDQKVYIDLGFYRELRDRFHAPGQFAQAYVIAHEIGHHVQYLLGTSEKVDRARHAVGHRRRCLAEGIPGLRRAGQLHPRYLGATDSMVRKGIRDRRSRAVQYIQGQQTLMRLVGA